MERLQREGFETRLRRHAAMAERVWGWAAEQGLDVLAPVGARSPTVTAITLEDAPGFVAAVAERGFTLGSGYGRLKANTFRIGHMGDQTLDTLEPLLACCTEVLARGAFKRHT